MSIIRGPSVAARGGNDTNLLNSLLLDGPASRADLSRRLNVNQMWISRQVDNLMRSGLIIEGETRSDGRGRPGKVLQLAVNSHNVAGFKVRDYKIIGALTNLEAVVLAQIELPIDKHSPSVVVKGISECLNQLLSQAVLTRDDVLGVGVGFSGLVDPRKGVLESSPFLAWKDVNIRELLIAALGIPVFVENDVNTLALAELWFGNTRAARNCLLVTIGQGIGLSVVRDGRILSIPGEFGHTQVSSSDRVCVCGNIGCLEATAGDAGLVYSVNQLSPCEPVSSVGEVYELARNNSKVREVLEVAADHLGRGLANLANIFKPETIFLSGEGLLAGDFFTEKVEESTNARCHPALRGSYKFVIDQLPEIAWARGAASLALHAVFDDSQFQILQDRKSLEDQ